MATRLPRIGRNRARQPTQAPTDGLERFAWLMDRAFKIPGTNIRFGLDPLVGLIPFGGDALMGLLQAGMVLVAWRRYQVPKTVAIRMISNVLIDMGFGSVPLVGDLFDVYFKASTRNVRLLQEAQFHARQGQRMPSGPSRRYLIGLALGLILLLSVVVALLVVLFLWVLKSLLGHPLI